MANRIKKKALGAEDWDEETAKANPGVPVVGKGTVLYLSEKKRRMLPEGDLSVASPAAPPAVNAAAKYNNPASGAWANYNRNPLANITLPNLPNPFQLPGVPQFPTAPQGGAISLNGSANSPVITGQNYNVPASLFVSPTLPSNQPVRPPQYDPSVRGMGETTPAGRGGTPLNRSRPGAYIPPAGRNVNPNQVTAADGTPSPPVPQSSTFDPNDKNSAAEWRTWWNWHASHPVESRVLLRQMAISQGKPDPFAVHVPTREEIWQMKAEKRHRGGAEESSSGVGGFAPSDYNFGIENTFYGNQVISASWRIGG